MLSVSTFRHIPQTCSHVTTTGEWFGTKVSVVPQLFRCFWSRPASLVWVLALVFGLDLLTLRPVSMLHADDKKTAEEEEEEDPLAGLTGLLDPSQAKPLMTVEQEKDFRKRKEPNYMRSALKSLSPNNAIEQQIREGMKFRVERLTMPENWPYMGNRTKDLVNDLDVFADGAPRAREMAAKAAVEELDKLLFSDQPLFVKINAAWLLGRLNIQSASVRADTPAVPYAPAAESLIKVLGDSQQTLDVKVAAIGGLERILEDGDPSRQMRDQIAAALTAQLGAIEELTPGDGRNWYHWRLVGALGAVRFPRSMTQQPTVVDALWKTMHDEELLWRIRARAVRSLGEVDLDASFNIPLLMHQIVLLAGKMTAEYNKNPNLSYWKTSFSDLYFTFRAQTPAQQQKGWGLLQNPPAGTQDTIQGAYQVVLPLVNGVLKHEKPQPVPIALLTAASKWMQANAPADKKIHPQAKPLEAAAQPAPVPAGDSRLSQPPTAPVADTKP
jgi:hypothetical protein